MCDLNVTVSNHVLITVYILENEDDLHLLCDKYAEENENQSVSRKRKCTKTAKGKALENVEIVENGDVEATSASKKRKKEPQSAQSSKNKKSKNAQQSEKQLKRSANVEAAQLRAKHYFEVMQDQERDDDLQQITYAEQTQLPNQTPNIDKNVQMTLMSNEQPPNNERQTPITKERRTSMTNKQWTPMIDDQRTVAPVTNSQQPPMTNDQLTPMTNDQRTPPMTSDQRTPMTNDQLTPMANNQRTPITNDP